MEIIEIPVDNPALEHYLSDILKDAGYKNGLIPTNRIINKRRPAIGATHGELVAKRHSILIEPYITVIEVKKEKFGADVCAVIKDFSLGDILTYLNDETIYHKKIITTPESFRKVIRVLKKHDPQYRMNFFLLIDECEKLIQHALFRNKIFDPITEFFAFDNKALISATPLPFSHPEFKIQHFKVLDIVPTFTYQKAITVITTNNIRTTLRNRLKLLNLQKDTKPVFLFTNCKRTILYFTRLEQVAGNFKVFCAEDLDDKFFKKNNTANVEYSVTQQSYAAYNAFTSRFFSAVDMFPHESAHIIVVTNLPYVPHSLIDPATEAVQIYGRDRKRAASITHITNLYPNNITGEDIDTQTELYFIQRLQDMAEKSTNTVEVSVLKAIIDKQLIAQSLKPDGRTEPFLLDHYELNKSIKQLYHSKQLLLEAYERSNFFIPTLIEVKHQFSDEDELKLARSNGKKKNKEFIAQLHKLLIEFDLYNEEEYDYLYQIQRLEKEDPFLFSAYRELGYEAIVQADYSKNKIKELVFNLKQQDTTNYFLMIDKILASFKLHVKIYVDDIEKTLQQIYADFGHEKENGIIHHAKGTDIEKYFKVKRINGKQKIDGVYKSYYRLYEPIDKVSKDLEYTLST